MKNHSQMSPGAALGLHLGAKNDETFDAKILVNFDAILGDFGAPFGNQKLTKMMKKRCRKSCKFSSYFEPPFFSLFSDFDHLLEAKRHQIGIKNR